MMLGGDLSDADFVDGRGKRDLQEAGKPWFRSPAGALVTNRGAMPEKHAIRIVLRGTRQRGALVDERDAWRVPMPMSIPGPCGSEEATGSRGHPDIGLGDFAASQRGPFQFILFSLRVNSRTCEECMRRSL